jgi:hypothetical protein
MAAVADPMKPWCTAFCWLTDANEAVVRGELPEYAGTVKFHPSKLVHIIQEATRSDHVPVPETDMQPLSKKDLISGCPWRKGLQPAKKGDVKTTMSRPGNLCHRQMIIAPLKIHLCSLLPQIVHFHLAH